MRSPAPGGDFRSCPHDRRPFFAVSPSRSPGSPNRRQPCAPRCDRPPARCLQRPDLRIARLQGRDDDHRRDGVVRLRPNRPGPNRTRTLQLNAPSEAETLGGGWTCGGALLRGVPGPHPAPRVFSHCGPGVAQPARLQLLICAGQSALTARRSVGAMIETCG